MQTRSQTRKDCKVYPDVLMNIKENVSSLPNINTFEDNQLKMVTRSKSRPNLNSISSLPIIENNEINIVTRSKSKKYYSTNIARFIPDSLMNNISYTLEKIENKVDIDFDNASRAWMRNKRKIDNGQYCYI